MRTSAERLRPNTPSSAPKAHVDRIARAPRPAGGSDEAEARAYCAGELRSLGFVVRERPFEYSAFPGLFGTPIAGAGLAIALVLAAWAGRAARPGIALATLVGALVIVTALGRWMARRGVLTLPWRRESAVNLECVRGDEPGVWLVAHLDSKSQPVSILVRAAGITLLAMVWIAAMTGAAAQLSRADVDWAWMPLTAIGVVAALTLMASVVGTASPGALDNASGVATVLCTAAALPRDRPLGVLLTSAEELGLAGARAWVEGRAPAVAINCDGVDDSGALTAMWSGGRPGMLISRLLTASRRSVRTVRVRRLLPGILVDAVALADAGWATITVSRGGVRTLARIHRPSDSPAALRGDGIAVAAELVTALVLALD